MPKIILYLDLLSVSGRILLNRDQSTNFPKKSSLSPRLYILHRNTCNNFNKVTKNNNPKMDTLELRHNKIPDGLT